MRDFLEVGRELRESILRELDALTQYLLLDDPLTSVDTSKRRAKLAEFLKDVRQLEEVYASMILSTNASSNPGYEVNDLPKAEREKWRIVQVRLEKIGVLYADLVSSR